MESIDYIPSILPVHVSSLNRQLHLPAKRTLRILHHCLHSDGQAEVEGDFLSGKSGL